jgi:hypothetical protein
VTASGARAAAAPQGGGPAASDAASNGEERVRRRVERGQNPSAWVQRWMAAENYYLERVRPSDSAEVVVLGE